MYDKKVNEYTKYNSVNSTILLVLDIKIPILVMVSWRPGYVKNKMQWIRLEQVPHIHLNKALNILQFENYSTA